MQSGQKYTVTLESWAADPNVVKNSVGAEVVQGPGLGFIKEINILAQVARAATSWATDCSRQLLRLARDDVCVRRCARPCTGLAWFAGQECGTAIARVLTGHTNPSGRLPFTWPRRLEDNPSFGNWPTNDSDEIFYRECLSVGYRYYDQPGAP
ncbi:glycosyl hydrolase family 3 C-terminal domain-containing protein [Aspergillus pseudodeflectus]|uniref:beta-glucosidase n=1 Tax=Aspergillus pseudodeflectus TaxID=176178 RepID=A0ABR4JNK3_9EURO